MNKLDHENTEPSKAPFTPNISDHDKTEPSIKAPFTSELYNLLIEEEAARTELIRNINAIIKWETPLTELAEIIGQVLIGCKEYMNGVKEITDIVKQG